MFYRTVEFLRDPPIGEEAQLVSPGLPFKSALSYILWLFWCTKLKWQFIKGEMFGGVVNDKAPESLYCIIIKTDSRNTPYLHSFISWDIPFLLHYLLVPVWNILSLFPLWFLCQRLLSWLGQASARTGFGWWIRLETHGGRGRSSS